MQDELLKSYMEVLNESTDSAAVKGSTLKSGEAVFGDFKTGNDSDENVDLDKPDESEHSTDPKEGEPKKLVKSSFQNPFDELYNKLVSEASFDFSTEEDNEIEPSGDLGGDVAGAGMAGDDLEADLGEAEDEIDDIEDLDEEGDEEGEEVDLVSLVDTLKDVLSQLEKIVDHEEDEDEDEEEGEEEEEEGEEMEEEGEEEEEEGEEMEEEEDLENLTEEGYLEKKWEKEKKSKKDKKKHNPKKKKSEVPPSKKEQDEEVAQEAVKVTGLKKGVNLKPFKGNTKKLQNKKAEVTDNSAKASKAKAQLPASREMNGMPTKCSPTAGHNLTKASNFTVSGAVKPNKSLFDQ